MNNTPSIVLIIADINMHLKGECHQLATIIGKIWK